MKMLIMIVTMALPLMALGQTTDQQQTDTQTKDTQTTAPAKAKKTKRNVQAPDQTEAKPQTSTDVRGQTHVKGRAQDVNRNQPGARSSTSETNVRGQTNVTGTNQTTTTVNKEEFRSRHADVFSLGRHPKEFFVHRYGANHFRLIGNTYFVFLDGCWVAVDVDGFVYTERVICAGDSEFIEVN
ncbi:MAG TPA: hypothetical protein VGM65_12640 [Candidatus Udaeobacter sp.]|jgi:hypothetical protein